MLRVWQRELAIYQASISFIARARQPSRANWTEPERWATREGQTYASVTADDSVWCAPGVSNRYPVPHPSPHTRITRQPSDVIEVNSTSSTPFAAWSPPWPSGLERWNRTLVTVVGARFEPRRGRPHFAPMRHGVRVCGTWQEPHRGQRAWVGGGDRVQPSGHVKRSDIILP